MMEDTTDKAVGEVLAILSNFTNDNKTTPSQENPTTYREIKGIGVYVGDQALMLLLPSSVPVADVLKSNLGRLLGERYLIILSYLYTKGLFRKSEGERGNFIKLHSNKVLRILGGEHYLRLMKYGLANGHLIQSPSNYYAGSKSKEYRITPDLLVPNTQQRYVLTSKHSIRIRKEWMAKNRRTFVENGEVHQKIQVSHDGLRFDYERALKSVRKIKDSKKRQHRLNVIGGLFTGLDQWTVDNQGRIYTTLVNLPKDLRQFCSHVQGDLFSVDITSCHPLLHVHLYPEDGDEKRKYQRIVQEGKFWSFMNEQSGIDLDLNDHDQKQKLKKRVLKEVYYSRPTDDLVPRWKMARTFKEEFPILWYEINDRKRQKQFKPSAGLAKAMMETESETVQEVVLRLKDKPYPLITIHDCIVTTKEGLDEVQETLRTCFGILGLSPKLDVKKITVDQSNI